MSGTDGCLVKCSSFPCGTLKNDTRDTSPTIVLDLTTQMAGDAKTFGKYGPYIEFIISLNNSDGIIREPVVSGG
ncbi:hypothetical protein RDI58_000909 [Solanum bulbocastanum]|uniref:Alliinase C-terminal domain-containing protein n=1 Tax=Solanum bulbocastanum TaxID=147425 RepID=A0AAN8UBK0_SOLBU